MTMVNFWLFCALGAACFSFLVAGCAWWYAAHDGNDLLPRSIAATSSGFALMGMAGILLALI